MTDWDQMLQDVEQRLAQTLAELDAATRGTAPAGERDEAWTTLAARLDGLSQCTTAADELVRQTDLALEEAEQALQLQAADLTALRQRLADWAARAIG
jgi:uncharacterized protein YgfB (UPF0149 family)